MATTGATSGDLSSRSTGISRAAGRRGGYLRDGDDRVLVDVVELARRNSCPEVKAQVIGLGVAAIQVRGELDLATVGQLEAGVDRALTRGSPPLLIDLTDCGFMDCSVVELLINLQVRLGNSGRPRFGVVAQDQPLRLLRLTGLDHEMPVFASLPEALGALDCTAPDPSPGSGSRGCAGQQHDRPS